MRPLKLKQESVTRWNSKYDILARLVTVKDAVSSVVASVKTVEDLTASEWEVAEEYVKVLKPFKVLTTVMSSSTFPTISIVIPELNKLEHTLQNDTSLEATSLPTLKEDLLASIDRRWPEYEANQLYAVSTTVDPRYKDCGLSDQSCAEGCSQSSAERDAIYEHTTVFICPGYTSLQPTPSASHSHSSGKSTLEYYIENYIYTR